MKKTITLLFAVFTALISNAQLITAIQFNESHVPKGVYDYGLIQMRIGQDEAFTIPDLGGIDVPGKFDPSINAYVISGAITLDFSNYPYNIFKIKVLHNGVYYTNYPVEDLGWGPIATAKTLLSPLDSLEYSESPDSVILSSVIPGAANISRIEIYADDATTVNSLNKKFTFDAFPNPVNNLLNIKAIDDGKAQVTIADITGKLVFEEKMDLTSHQKIDFSIMPKGSYLVSVQSENQTFTKKIIK